MSKKRNQLAMPQQNQVPTSFYAITLINLLIMPLLLALKTQMTH
jgi:ferric iron reductase protein FhuF